MGTPLFPNPNSISPASGFTGGYMGNGLPPPTPGPKIPFGSSGSFSAAAEQQGGDYDKIMSDYDALLKSSSAGGEGGTKLNFTPIAPNTKTYQPSSGLQSALAQFQSVAATGGFGDTDVSNIRARGVSPIRAIYANAQRNLARQKNLQGGYSPNYGAASAKMAREESEQIGQANTNLEATIAEMVQKGKLAALPGIASLATEENRNKQIFDQQQQDQINRINELNATLPMQYGQYNANLENQNIGNRLQAIEGKRTLYGTTPALTNMFGNQVTQANQTAQNQQQIKNQQNQATLGAGMNMIDAWGRPIPILG